MQEQQVAVRRWPPNCGPNAARKALVEQKSNESSSSKVSRSGTSSPAVTSPNRGNVAARTSSSSRSATPVITVDSDAEDDKSVHKEDVKEDLCKSFIEEDEDTIIDPDEEWRPKPGQITRHGADEDVDWVMVKRKKIDSEGNVEEIKTLALPGNNEILIVPPLSTAYTDICIAELTAFEEDDFDVDVDPEQHNGDPRSLVVERMQMFDKFRLRFIQEMNSKQTAHNKAAATMNRLGLWVNRGRRVGPIPGVEVGDIFYFRIAMCVVGLHKRPQAGIATIPANRNQWGELVADSLVLSGGYEDDVDHGDNFVYTGEGGNDYSKTKRQTEDQKLIRGNLGLANSCRRDISVRVIRGVKDPSSPTGTIYSYDGLYKVVNYWPEMGQSGFLVYRYMLEREHGQRERGSQLVRFSGKLKKQELKREKMVSEDISNGKSPVPVCCVNEVDDPPAPPTGFTYISKIIFPPNFTMPPIPSGCRCRGPCGDSETCKCIRKNGGSLPYTTDGTLIDSKTIVYECGPYCGCPATCPNRVSQRGQKVKLEVFKTENRGWGVRSWDPIPYGTFICEYVGELIDNEEAERRVGRDEYIFDIDCINGSRSRGVDISCYFEKPSGGELCERIEDGNMSIDAGTCGNLSRFINHSCDPNMYVQCVFFDHYDLTIPHIMMFAMKDIRPFEELGYDYGYALNSVRDVVTGVIKKKPCYCGSRKCRRRLY